MTSQSSSRKMIFSLVHRVAQVSMALPTLVNVFLLSLHVDERVRVGLRDIQRDETVPLLDAAAPAADVPSNHVRHSLSVLQPLEGSSPLSRSSITFLGNVFQHVLSLRRLVLKVQDVRLRRHLQQSRLRVRRQCMLQCLGPAHVQHAQTQALLLDRKPAHLTFLGRVPPPARAAPGARILRRPAQVLLLAVVLLALRWPFAFRVKKQFVPSVVLELRALQQAAPPSDVEDEPVVWGRLRTELIPALDDRALGLAIVLGVFTVLRRSEDSRVVVAACTTLFCSRSRSFGFSRVIHVSLTRLRELHASDLM